LFEPLGQAEFLRRSNSENQSSVYSWYEAARAGVEQKRKRSTEEAAPPTNAIVICEMPPLGVAKPVSFVQKMRHKRQKTQGGPGVDLTNAGPAVAM